MLMNFIRVFDSIDLCDRNSNIIISVPGGWILLIFINIINYKKVMKFIKIIDFIKMIFILLMIVIKMMSFISIANFINLINFIYLINIIKEKNLSCDKCHQCYGIHKGDCIKMELSFSSDWKHFIKIIDSVKLSFIHLMNVINMMSLSIKLISSVWWI